MMLKKVIFKLPLFRFLQKYRLMKETARLAQEQLLLAVKMQEELWKKSLEKAGEQSVLAQENKVIFDAGKQVDVIVSMTSYGKRVETVHLTILSILNQTVRPLKVILWLAENEFILENLPEPLLALQSYGLEIHFCEDIRSFKKLIPTLLLYPSKNIVTFDDDVIYPENQLEKLLDCHQIYPNAVVCNRAHKIVFGRDGMPLPYQQWQFDTNEQELSHSVIPIGIGGVLYPAGSLAKEVLNQSAFKALCPTADDLWFKLMAMKQNTLTKVVAQPMPYKDYLHIPCSQETSLWASNQFENDRQLRAILNAYPEISFNT